MLSWLRRRAAEQGVCRPDPEILDCLKDVRDPEVGVGIVALGLVYRAERMTDRIEVDLTLTSRACPLGAVLREDVLSALRSRWPDRGIVVNLVWCPAWTPERISEEGLALLGHEARTARLGTP